MYRGNNMNNMRTLTFVTGKESSLTNRYIVGSGVGATSQSNRAAYKKRANNNTLQKPCCNIRPD